MARQPQRWKRGRGKLGSLAPLIGAWTAEAATPIGPVRCTRIFAPALRGSYVQLVARWEFKKGQYEEQAFFGVDRNRQLSFWSFTSDGKQSEGHLADARDIHPEAVGFEAEMPAGLARMVYWPNDEGGMTWAVEAKSKKGWRRFTEHHYRRTEPPEPR